MSETWFLGELSLLKKTSCPCLFFPLNTSFFPLLFFCSSINSRCPSQASFPRPACRPSSAAPCCTCQTARWARIAALPRPTASTAALRLSTTSSPPRARKTGGSWTSWVPRNQIWSPHLIHLQNRCWQAGPVLEDESAQWYAVCHVCEDCLYSVKLWVCNFTITERLKYSLLAQISGCFPLSWTNSD